MTPVVGTALLLPLVEKIKVIPVGEELDKALALPLHREGGAGREGAGHGATFGSNRYGLLKNGVHGEFLLNDLPSWFYLPSFLIPMVSQFPFGKEQL